MISATIGRHCRIESLARCVQPDVESVTEIMLIFMDQRTRAAQEPRAGRPLCSEAAQAGCQQHSAA